MKIASLILLVGLALTASAQTPVPARFNRATGQLVEPDPTGIDVGSNDTYAVTLTPSITAYQTGGRYTFRANTANTGAATINFNGLGAKTIVKVSGGTSPAWTTLSDDDIRAGQWVDLIYDGTVMQMQGVLGNSSSITDGDKGDITVSGAGAVWTIDSATIALSKMANLAQNKIIGRFTASTGVPEAITVGGDFTLTAGTMALAVTPQPLDADLTALAGLTLAQNKFYARLGVGSGVADTAVLVGPDFALAGNTLALANAYQPLDADLTTLADGDGSPLTFTNITASGLWNGVGARVLTASAMSGSIVNTALLDQTKTIAANTTLTISGTPSSGTLFGFTLTADSSGPYTVTLPAGTWKDAYRGVTITSFSLAASQRVALTVSYDGTNYWMDGAPTNITDSDLSLAVKPAVAVVAVANLTLSGEQTIDGVTTTASLVLATAQSTGSQNGPWVTAAGAWARPGWYTAGSTTQAPQFCTTQVRLGTLYAGSVWRLTTANVTIGTTSATWSRITLGSSVTDQIAAAFFAADAGANDTYTATLSPVPAAYVTGAPYRFKANTANTGAATINFNSLGAKTIVKVAGGITTTLADNDIRSGQWVDLVYDGTNMQIQSTLGAASSSGGHSLTFTVDGAGGALTTGVQLPVKTPYGGTLTGYTMMCSPSGSVTFNIFRAADTAGLPTASIINSAGGGGGSATLPAIASGVEGKSTTFTSWGSTTITAFDNLALNLTTVDGTVTKVSFVLYYQ